jgi:hypothetical protein
MKYLLLDTWAAIEFTKDVDYESLVRLIESESLCVVLSSPLSGKMFDPNRAGTPEMQNLVSRVSRFISDAEFVFSDCHLVWNEEYQWGRVLHCGIWNSQMLHAAFLWIENNTSSTGPDIWSTEDAEE